ncbi:TetR/AcrR family transcriptional regulator [Streptomyces sp. MZ04]|uniref:TetR/AcrR family transcriptional regulator n=1 Tax=Streptomyces sp. MZ04 TaxID=2559236 RepID=UPI00107E6668|nr:TetR/AcrR family transcriptional regulator [Streptomyces sp. MZ04]TGA99642.1 TetR/AcrR family transcriptional regulator [Streptomyces sp. MZ04]
MPKQPSSAALTPTPVPKARSHRDKILDGALVCLQEKGYARTTARDVAEASGAGLGSIGYHFGGMEGLLDEALGRCFEVWTARVRDAVSASAGQGPRAQLESALVALIDSYDELRPMVVSYIEAFPPAARSAALRERLAAGYAQARRAGYAMTADACAELGIAPPPGAEVLSSVVIALCDGLMLQWIVDPEATPDAHEVLDALTLIAPFLTPAD